ncbi:hypothetical protein SAV14893_094410 [Streptomyces avermitilis]|uniref:Uncharacterized protein n=1 Tax=Streptomyces avermitilis TaxID=33903 RepID=A0A4D4NA37_STRAX|nr:hypothetical protein SAV14893_094410 [Streptomyces avermitilis]GDY80325.1 hypothetical protein SAV31267_098100 [Streptomyces avermitilis]
MRNRAAAALLPVTARSRTVSGLSFPYRPGRLGKFPVPGAFVMVVRSVMPGTHGRGCGWADHEPDHGFCVPIVTVVGGSWSVVGSGLAGFLKVSKYTF